MYNDFGCTQPITNITDCFIQGIQVADVTWKGCHTLNFFLKDGQIIAISRQHSNLIAPSGKSRSDFATCSRSRSNTRHKANWFSHFLIHSLMGSNESRRSILVNCWPHGITQNMHQPISPTKQRC